MKSAAGISIREAAKQAVLASLQADTDSVIHTDVCCYIRHQSSQQQSTNARGHIREAARYRSSSSSNSNRIAKGLLLLLRRLQGNQPG